MAYTTINKSSDHFNTKLYTGTGSTQTITTGHQPDLIWIKQRTTVRPHVIFDSVNSSNFAGGNSKYIKADSTAALTANNSTQLTANSSTGFTLGSDDSDQVNHSGSTAIAWSWKANGAGSANTDGSINSTVSANTTSGVSIVKYVGSGSNATVGHGLSTAPTAIFCKNLDSGSEQWINYDVSSGATKYYHLNMSNGTSVGSTIWNDTAPTTSVFSVGTVANCNSSGVNYVAYCFSNIPGFSKVGGYSGNGNANGTFVYTGFKPSFIFIKRTNDAGNWVLKSQVSPGYNVNNNYIYGNTATAEASGSAVDFLSNGFKWRIDGANQNGSDDSYIYIAFAEKPLVASNGVPATAE